ncbi:MAG: hypothetical protein MK088_20945, partial [Alteromonas sp.]|nr:hypothetical protein [Alteromonas sp.]
KGKFTLPLLLLLESLPVAERESLLTRYKQGDSTVAAAFSKRLHNFPIFETVVESFEEQLSQASRAIGGFSDVPASSRLQMIAQLVRAQLARISRNN